MNLGTLLVTIAGNAGPYKKSLNQASAETSKMSKRMAGAAKLAATGLLAISVAAMKTAADMEEAYKQIRVGSGSTGQALKGLKADFHAVFGEVPQDAEKVSSAIADLNSRLDLSGKPLQDLSTKFLKLDTVIKGDLNGSIAATTRMFGDWSVAAEDHSKTMDFMFRASQETGAGYTYIAEQVVNYGAALRNLGLDMNTSISLIAKWEKEGVNMTTVMSGMKQAVGYFGKEGINAADGLQQLIKTIETSDEKTGKLAAKTVVGQEAFNDFYDAVKGGKFDLEELVEALEKGSDSIDKAAADSETSAEKMEKAWRKVQEELAPVGEELINQLVPAIEDSLPAILEIVKALGTVITVAVKIPSAIHAAAEAFAGFHLGGQSTADQNMQLSFIDADHEVWVRQMREKHQLTGEWMSRMKDQGVAMDDIYGKMDFLIGSTDALSKVEKEYIKTLAESISEEEAKALRFINLRDAILEYQKAHKKKSQADKEDTKNNKENVNSQKAVASSIDDLNKKKDELLSKIRADIAATGDVNMVLLNHREELEEVADETRKWGQELDPTIASAENLYDAVDKNDKALADLHKTLTKINETTEDTSENWKEYVGVVQESEDDMPTFDDLIGDTEDAADMAEHLANQYEQSLTKDFVKSLDFASDYFCTIFGDSGSELARATQTFLHYFDESLGDMEAMWSAHWKELSTVGLSTLGNMVPGSAGRGFSGASGGFSLGSAIGSLIPGGAIAGGIIGGVAGFVGGFFGGGGKSDEEKRRDAAEKARKEQERLNALYERFSGMVSDALENQTEYSDEMAHMFVELQAAGYSFEDVTGMITDSIEEWEDKIKDAETALSEWPDQLFAMQDNLENLRFGLIDINERIKGIRAELREVAGAPIKLQVVEEDLKSAMAELKAAEAAYEKSKSKEDKKRLDEARDKVRELEQERDRLKDLGEIKMKNVNGKTFTGDKAKDAMLRQIRKAKKASEEAGRHGKITAKQYKEMMANAETPEAKALLKQLILAENAKIDRKLQIKRQREQLLAAKKAKNALQQNLPKMKDRLADLLKFKADFGSKGFKQIHDDLTTLQDKMKEIFGYAKGGPITNDQLAVLHAGEVVLNKAQVGAFSKAFNTPTYSSQAAVASTSAPTPVYTNQNSNGGGPMIVEGIHHISLIVDGREVARAVQPYSEKMVKSGHSRTKRSTLQSRGGAK